MYFYSSEKKGRKSEGKRAKKLVHHFRVPIVNLPSDKFRSKRQLLDQVAARPIASLGKLIIGVFMRKPPSNHHPLSPLLPLPPLPSLPRYLIFLASNRNPGPEFSRVIIITGRDGPRKMRPRISMASVYCRRISCSPLCNVASAIIAGATLAGFDCP